ncbi:MAG: amino acid adenylation domain-containing protein [Acidobacteriota bacterium]|nr:amino acid adenylation domain-containing protein [Acidobacteriota bacterium]
MSTVTDLMTDLRERGVKLWVEGEKLRFKAPEKAMTPDLMGRLRRHKQDLLDFLAQASGNVRAPIRTAPRLGARRPLSFAQQRMWFLSKMSSANSAFHISGAFHWRGPLRIGLLKRCVDAILRRHEVLITRLVEVDGQPVAEVSPEVDFQPEVIDLTRFSLSADHPVVTESIAREPAFAFDMSRPPLVRLKVLVLAEREAVLLLTLHHIIADGWSMGVIMRELTTLYAGELQQGVLPALPVQYADYAYDQRRRLDEGGREAQLGFWREYLKDAPATLELPTDRPRPALKTFNGDALPVSLGSEGSAALADFCRRTGATSFIVLNTLFQLLLARVCGRRDIVVGTPVAGRTREELEPLIGLFVNTLVLRNRFEGNPSFLHLLDLSARKTLAAFDHQDLPFDRVVEELDVPRDPSRSPIFQVMFAFQNTPGGGSRLEDVSLEPLEQPVTTAQVDLTLDLFDTGGLIHGLFRYNTDLFDRETVAGFARSFKTLVDAALASPESPVFNLDLMTREEKAHLLDVISLGEDVEGEPSGFIACFNSWVERAPDAPALISEEGVLTYSGLQNRAGALAQTLAERGLLPGDHVVVCLPGGPDAVIAFLAILSSGGVYVPLDPEIPAQRAVYQLEDADPAFLVADPSTELPDHRAESIDPAAVLPNATAHVLRQPDPEHQAYMIYTSGSTGKPKGVQVSHHNLAWFAQAARNVMAIGPGDRMLQYASLVFDVSILDYCCAMNSGAALCLGNRKQLLGAQLNEFIRRHEVTHALLSPTAASFLNGPIPALRVLSTAGEQCPAHLVQRLAPGRTYINSYGPTETTVIVTAQSCKPENRQPGIGQPVAGTRALVLDPLGNPVPAGVPGELCVGGNQVARGYRGKPGLTAAAFIPDPFSKQPGARLYRTGDLTRLRHDGSLEFMGRLDHQIKLRGFRIELGEIETNLADHPHVTQAIVLLRTEKATPYLAAFFTAGEITPDNGSLRSHLAETLPDYMIPSAFVHLESLPLTSSGKVDRKALNERPVEAQEETGEFMAPRDELETRLAAIWCDVLDLKRVSVQANFFELGGHSLLATQVISRIREQMGVELPVHRIFAAPTIADLADLLRGEQETTHDGFHVPPRTEGEPLPLSFAQQRLWFLDQFEGPSTVYNMPMPLNLEGELDTAVLERALSAMHSRHEVLRTHFPKLGGEPVQHIEPAGGFHLDVIDLSAASFQDSRVMAMAARHAQRPFRLDTGPLFRVSLVRMSESRHVLLVNMHHIICDGWSMGVIVRELAELYDAFLTRGRSNLPELPLQYADFARRQRALIDDQTLSAQAEYWKTQLADAAPLLELPTDRPRPAVQTYRGAQQHFSMPADLVAKLEQTAQNNGATLFMVLQAAFVTLLGRYSGSEDLVIGSPIANRNHKVLEPLIGFFVNTLALRTDLGGNPSFNELLDRVRQTSLDAYANQDLPFEQVVELVQPERNQSFSPLFQVMLILQNATDGDGLQLPGLELTPLAGEIHTAKFDLTLGFDPGPRGQLTGSLEFNTDLFDPATIERMIAHLQTLLNLVPQNPGLAAIDLLQEEERRRLLIEWAGEVITESLAPIPETIALIAAASPDTPALQWEAGVWTYSELLSRADALAAHLQHMGVGPETVVGVSMQRSAAQMAAVLAILRAGACCLPVDPDYPATRRDFMLADSGLTVLLCDDSQGCRARDVLTLKLDERAQPVQAVDATFRQPALYPDHPAYMIYTSGSTGRPKGVAVTHRILANITAWQRSGLGEPARTLQFASLSFDVSFQELATTWATGGCLFPVDTDTRMDMAALLDRIQTLRIERLFLPFVALQQLAETAIALDRMPDCLRDVITAGEQLHVTPAVATLFHQIGARLHNHYGPSETHVATALTLTGDPMNWPELPSIGKPIDGDRVFVLDPLMNPVPIGVPGELFLGGAAPARGYVNRPALTASRFLPDPFALEPGARLYRTGDRVRFLPNGELAFLGRVDFQIKLRGFRVEPGEVESALVGLEEVSQGAVMIRDDEPGDRYLAAYVQLADAQAPEKATVTRIRESLKQSLPDYMVPASFTVLNHLPLTPSGKLDRRALPKPQRLAGDKMVAPRNPVEARLAAIWAEVLKLETVSVEADFFELGGHSLLATRVMTRIREEFGADLAVRELFGAPTVVQLAELLYGHSPDIGPQAPKIQPADRSKPIPLSHAQMRMWFLDRLGDNGAAFNLVDPLKLTGPLDVDALCWSLRELVQRHEGLRLCVRSVESGAVAHFDSIPDDVVQLTDLSDWDAAVQKELVISLLTQEVIYRFNLEEGPLYRLNLVRLNEQEHVLLMNLHHMISDGWSSGILTREFSKLYSAALAGQPSPLAPLRIQYADYAAWQQEHLVGEALEARVDYWRKQLANLTTLELPTDRPRPDLLRFDGDEVHLTLPPELGEKLQALARTHRCSLFMVLISAFKLLLGRLANQDDIPVGTPIAGRNHEGTENLVGCFLNILVLRGDLSGDPRFTDLLARVREMTLDAYEHQDVAFEQLLEELQPRRDLSRNPLFQVYFNLMNFDSGAVESGPLTMERVSAEVEGTTTKFDLALYVMEHGSTLGLRLIFNKHLFNKDTAGGMLQRFQTLAKAITAQPEARLSTLPVLDGAEARTLCKMDQMPLPDRPKIDFGKVETSLGERFAEVVGVHGAETAVVAGDRTWTYRQLRRMAAGVTAALNPFRGDRRAALLFSKDLSMTAAVFGVLRAGLTYVPIDPNYPKGRKETILRDAEVSVLLTDKENQAEALELAEEIPVIFVDREPGGPVAPLSKTSPHGPAYLLYTSGTTGVPKGVMQSHRNVLTHVRNYTQNLRIGPDDRVSMLPGYSFDAAIMDFYGALLNGASLHLYDLLRDGFEKLADWIDQQQITILHLTPTVFRHLVGGLAEDRILGSVRMLVLGGEASVRADFTAYKRHFDTHCLMVNGLGPTESTLALQNILDHNSTFRGNQVPLGGPVDGLDMLLVNEEGLEVADFSPGEIVLRGDHLALGYWNKPTETDEVFQKDNDGNRLYRTGDRARRTEEGCLVFAGRADDQLKIRGFRIEPAGIEAKLTDHDAVREAVVLPRQRVDETVLVAYAVAQEGAQPKARALRTYLAMNLPDYMVPAAVVLLENLPRTAHGKLDRRALPEPEWINEESYTAPTTETEIELAVIWSEVL